MRASSDPSFEKIDVLLVDDREENLLALEAVLGNDDYNLIKRRSGSDALRYLLDHTPALILMDVQMPGLNGFETAALIKGSERTRDIPIIFITAINKDEKFVHQGYAEGAVDYIYKPYDPEVLRAKVAVFADIHRQHERISRLVAIQRATTLALADFDNTDEGVRKVLKAMGVSLKWDLVLFWEKDRANEALRCRSEWHNPVFDFSRFIEESFQRSFTPPRGLPGETWASQTARWIPDFVKGGKFPRFAIASQEELHAAVGIPVSVQGEMLGVLEFFTQAKLPEDPDLLRIMEAIGAQFAQVLKRTEAIRLLRLSGARKAAILEGALDGIVSMNSEGQITEFNPAAEKIFGYSRADVLGKDMANLIIPQRYRSAHRQGLVKYLESGEGRIMGKRLELMAHRSDGTEFPAELAITRVAQTDPPLFTGFIRDITERKRAEANAQLLSEASDKLASTFNYEQTFTELANLAANSIADWCIIDVALEGEEPRTMAVAHKDKARLEVMQRLREKFPPDWNAKIGAANVIKTGKSELYEEIPDSVLEAVAENEEHLKDIRELGVKSAIVVPLVARKKTLGALTLIISESNRRYTAADLEVAEELATRAAIAIDNAKLYFDAQLALRSRDEFFSIASHELKTPISVLKMSVELLQDGMKMPDGRPMPPEVFSKMLTTSSRHADRLARMIDDQLDVVRARAGKLGIHLEEVNLSDLVKDVAEQYAGAAESAKCSIELNVESDVTGCWDRTRVEQVVINLISNAIKYAPGKPIRVEVSSYGDTARFVVQDGGPGIPKEKQAKLFNRFERIVASRTVTGLGLGLFIVKQIIEAHHGKIHVESEPGNGARFVVELPQNLVADEAKEAPKREEPPRPQPTLQ